MRNFKRLEELRSNKLTSRFMSQNPWIEFTRAQYLLLLAIYAQHLWAFRGTAVDPILFMAYCSWKLGVDALTRSWDNITLSVWETSFSCPFSSARAPLSNNSDLWCFNETMNQNIIIKSKPKSAYYGGINQPVGSWQDKAQHPALSSEKLAFPWEFLAEQIWTKPKDNPEHMSVFRKGKQININSYVKTEE